MKTKLSLTQNEIAALFEPGNIYSWADVSRVHQTRMGIYQKNEFLISLLTDFGSFNPCYPDKIDQDGNRVFYTGNGRRGDQGLTPANRSLLAAIENRHTVPLFNKLKVGEWRFEGFWRVESGEYIFDNLPKRMVWRFSLLKINY